MSVYCLEYTLWNFYVRYYIFETLIFTRPDEIFSSDIACIERLGMKFLSSPFALHFLHLFLMCKVVFMVDDEILLRTFFPLPYYHCCNFSRHVLCGCVEDNPFTVFSSFSYNEIKYGQHTNFSQLEYYRN